MNLQAPFLKLNLGRLLGRFILVFSLIFPMIWYLFSWYAVIHDPKILYATDFIIQYTAGQVISKFGGYFLYNPNVQLTVQNQIIPPNLQLTVQNQIIPDESPFLHLLPFNHPPLLAPLLKAISALSFPSAYILWTVIQLLLWAGCLWIIKSKWIDKSQSPYIQRINLISLILFYPAFLAIIIGQDSIFVLLVIIIWLAALQQRQYILAGIALAFSLLRPQIGLALAIPFIFTLPILWWSFVVTGGLLTVFSLVLVGYTGVFDYLAMISATAKNSHYIINQESMVNFSGIILRYFPNANTTVVQGLGWIAYLLTIMVLSYVFKRVWNTYIQTKNHSYLLWVISLLVVGVLFFSPYLQYHDLVLILIPVVMLINFLIPTKASPSTAAYPVLIVMSLFLLFSDLSPGYWRFTGTYLLWAFILLALIISNRRINISITR